MAVDHGNAGRGLPLVECSVTFLTPEDGGRAVPWGPGALSGNRYRPHIVIGDPNQRQAILDERGRSAEESVGVAFHDGPALPEPGKEMKVVLTLMYFPHPMYDKLIRGATFTLREGSKVVAHGEICRWLE
jgi:hypothetical protein